MKLSGIPYYILYGMLWTLSLLPMKVLYVISDGLYCLVYYLIRYRRSLVRRQLIDCFPEKSSEEILKIERRFYRFLCDLVVEMIKQITISKEEMLSRVEIEGMMEASEELIHRGKNFVFLYLGHYCNWEWMASFAWHLVPEATASQIYHPLKNPWVDRFFVKLRSQFGGKSVAMKDTLRYILNSRREGAHELIGFIADQSPKWEAMHHWSDFLNHKTSFFIGCEKIGKQVDAGFAFCSLSRPRRGYYKMKVIPMTWDAKSMPEYALTDQYVRMLEASIRQQPELWLWTHNRWKRTYEEWLERQKK